MNKKLVQYFSGILPLTDEEAGSIAATMTVKEFKKGTILLKEGEVSEAVYFVLEGCVRQYYMVDGEERTNNFFTENQWVISVNGYGGPSPSTHFVECCLDSTLVVGNSEKADALYKQFPKFEIISRKILEKIFAEQQQLVASYLTDTPEQRYLKLLKSRPDLFQHIPQYQIASYIGVKPESLSRIRKRIMHKP